LLVKRPTLGFMAETAPQRAEVVVVGAGTAGGLVAHRLAQQGRQVLVVEAGSVGALPPLIRSVNAAQVHLESDRWWNRRRLQGEAVRGGLRWGPGMDVGRGLGGSSAINYMVLCPGDEADFRGVSLAGNRWPAAIIDVLKRMPPGVPVHIPDPGPIARAYGQRLAQQGWPSFIDEHGHRIAPSRVGLGSGTRPSHELDSDGFVPAALAASDDQRWVSADLLGRPRSGNQEIGSGGSDAGLVVVQGEVKQLLVGTRAGEAEVNGVRLADGTMIVAPSVVLCGGAVLNLALLARSGLLPPHYRPPMRNHPGIALAVEIDRDQQIGNGPRVAPAITALHRWSSGVTGHPHDLMTLVVEDAGSGADQRRYGALLLMLAHSTGSSEKDRIALVEGIRALGGMIGGDPTGVTCLSGMGIYADQDGLTFDSLLGMNNEQIKQWCELNRAPVNHLVGTCEPLVDLGQGGVFKQVKGLRILDGSVLPSLPSGTPQLAILAMSESLLA